MIGTIIATVISLAFAVLLIFVYAKEEKDINNKDKK